MPSGSTLPPVYPGLAAQPSDLISGLNVKFLTSDARLVISVAGTSSILYHLCQHAIRHAAATILANDWSLADHDRFIEYIRERSVAGLVAPAAAAPDDPGRDKGAGKSATKSTGKRPKSGKNAAR